MRISILFFRTFTFNTRISSSALQSISIILRTCTLISCKSSCSIKYTTLQKRCTIIITIC
ncbi:unnamed protein product [Paramecium sonneborni]|uniref:Uncharacterized protein n=1 Tax=Paramecium sonneborni TaxID=65129 RepID=A0A8S1JYC6_9CILI|nr:unnamed protein product [Paramecium sonneborni]